MRIFSLFIKRCLDVLLSLFGLVLVSPLMLIIAILIIIDSKGPVFFKQERLGKNGRVFKIIKFRTMITDAEKKGDGLTVKEENDVRITKIGKLLRKLSLDELPQLLNVFIGNMSLVGPRPPVTYYPYNGYAKYPEWMKLRFQVRPGITGLAQVTYRNSAIWNQRIFLDVKYVKKFSILLDCKILLFTIKSLLVKNNIYGYNKKKTWQQPPL